MSIAESQLVVVGAGPAGTSAALALRERGLPVHLIDAGEASPTPPPAGSYLEHRFNDVEQWRWLVGTRGEALESSGQTSPKLRVPGLRALFDGYAVANRLHAQANFQLVGALAAGGMSTAWGCGVARFNDAELGPLRAERTAFDAAYARVAVRMGLSGASDDPLHAELGLDQWSDPALPLDALHGRIWAARRRLPDGFLLGRARVAVLGSARVGRAACDQSGLCLWGCPSKATWSAALDAESLRRDPGVRFESGVRVDAIEARQEGGYLLSLDHRGQRSQLRADRVVLAAGTLATTRLVWNALPNRPTSLRLQSNPMAAFLLLLPAMLGRAREPAFGLAQLSHSFELAAGVAAFGNLFSTAGLPVSEFAQHLPMGRRAGIPLLRALLPATVVGNVFLSGALSAHRLSLDADGSMQVIPGAASDLEFRMQAAKSRVASAYRKLGAWMLPGSFVAGAPGGDLHYAATLPHAAQPEPHQCGIDGQLSGLPGLYVVDGAALPVLPAKPHTLTIMANADRIARQIPA